MKNSLEGKVALVIGLISPVVENIVSTLLKKGCVVMAPAKSLQQLNWLKEIAAGIPTGRLLSQITDVPDYEKAQDMAEAIIEKYGRIDIAVTAMIVNKVMTGLSDTCMNDWENMLDQSITPCFVMNRIIISMMKQGHKGMYVNVSEKMTDDHKCSSLSKIAATVQMQLSKQFAEEAAANGIRYHSLLVQSESQPSSFNENTAEIEVTAAETGNKIANLFTKENVLEPAIL